MSSGTLKVGVAAILVGLAGAYLLRVYLNQEPPAVAAAPPQMTVPLASIDLPPGRTLQTGDMGLMSMTQEEVDARGYDLSRVMLSPEQITGRILKGPVRQGQPFLTTDLYPEGTGPNPLERLKPGYRAVDIQVPSTRGGSVETGTFVDVLFRSNPKPATEDTLAIPEVTVTLATGLEVIHVARPELSRLQAVVGYVAKEPTITLAASPQDARVFQTVQGRGELTLVARSPEDPALSSLNSREQMTFEELLGIQPRPEPNEFTTVIYRRGDASAQTFRVQAPAENTVRRPATMPSDNGSASVRPDPLTTSANP